MEETIDTKKVEISKLFFYIAYTIYLFKIICGQIKVINNISEILTLIEMLLLLACLLIQTRYYKKKVILLIIGTLLISLYSYIETINSDIFLLLAFIYAAKNIVMENFIKFDIKLKILFLCMNIFFIFIGLLENTVAYRESGSIRQTFGFASPNSFGGIIMSICLEMVYLKRNRLNGLTYIKLLGISLLIFLFCDSRSAEMCIILMAIAIVFFKKRIYLKKILPYTMIILTILSLVLVYMYEQGNIIAYQIDDLVSTRILCAYSFFNRYEVNLFGNYFEPTDVWLGYANTIDNAYINLILNHGLISYLLILAINFSLMKYAIKEKNNILVAILLVLLIYGLMEKGTYTIAYNVFLLFAKNIIYSKETNKLKDEDNGRINKYYYTSI